MIKQRFVRKYMHLAKLIGEDDNNCYARQIGTVIVKFNPDGSSRILSTGYNSPPKNLPHCNQYSYLKNVFWTQLTPEEKLLISLPTLTDEQNCERFSTEFHDRKICPRKLINAPSGKRLELCSCAHSEANAIVNATQDLYDSTMFCYCPLPCAECAKLIVNSGVKNLFCLSEIVDYSPSSRWLLKNINVVELDKDSL